MAGNPEELFDSYDESDDLDDHSEIEPSAPATSIQHAAQARRKLEQYWADKRLAEQLKSLNDWDEE